jgi:hypothetical protein
MYSLGRRSRGLLRPSEAQAGRTISVELELFSLDVLLFHTRMAGQPPV